MTVARSAPDENEQVLYIPPEAIAALLMVRPSMGLLRSKNILPQEEVLEDRAAIQHQQELLYVAFG
jgi:hypothetical protein